MRRVLASAALVSCAVIAIALVTMLAVENSSSPTATSLESSATKVTSASKHSIAAAVRLAKKKGRLGQTQTSEEQEANHLATVDLGQEVGAFAHAHPKLPGQKAMLHVTGNNKNLASIRQRLTAQLQKRYP